MTKKIQETKNAIGAKIGTVGGLAKSKFTELKDNVKAIGDTPVWVEGLRNDQQAEWFEDKEGIHVVISKKSK